MVTEANPIALQRMRMATRSNAAWQMFDDKHGGLSPKAYKEIELCSRYAAALGNRYLTLLGKLDEARDKLNARYDRLYKAIYGIERSLVHPD